MISLWLFVAVMLLVTPWKRLPMSARVWAAAASLNAAVFLAIPSTASTSPLRDAWEAVVVVCASLSAVFVLAGIVLWQRDRAEPGVGWGWAAPLFVAALPGLLYALIWGLGPFY